MNNFEELFRLALTMEDKEKVRLLNWIYKQGTKLIRLNKQFGSDISELENTHKQLKEFIERI